MTTHKLIRTLILLFAGMLSIIFLIQLFTGFSGGANAITGALSLMIWACIWGYFFPESLRPKLIVGNSRVFFYASLVLLIASIFPLPNGNTILARLLEPCLSQSAIGAARLGLFLVCVTSGFRSLIYREATT